MPARRGATRSRTRSWSTATACTRWPCASPAIPTWPPTPCRRPSRPPCSAWTTSGARQGGGAPSRPGLGGPGDRLYSLALRITRDPDLASDAVQEAFATALQRVDDFRGEARLGTWLHRIVYTKAIDLLRARGREAPLPEEDAPSRPPDDDRLGGAPTWSR